MVHDICSRRPKKAPYMQRAKRGDMVKRLRGFTQGGFTIACINIKILQNPWFLESHLSLGAWNQNAGSFYLCGLCGPLYILPQILGFRSNLVQKTNVGPGKVLFEGASSL